MAQREVHRRQNALREIDWQQQATVGSGTFKAHTPDDKLNEFIEYSRKFQEALVKKWKLEEPQRTGEWSDLKWVHSIAECTMSDGLREIEDKYDDSSADSLVPSIQWQRADRPHNYKEADRIVTNIKREIEKTYSMFGLSRRDYNLGIVFIPCYDFAKEKTFVVTLFKVYTFKGGKKRPVAYITKNQKCYSTIDEFYDRGTLDLPHCCICVPRRGEYHTDLSTLPLEFLNINTHRVKLRNMWTEIPSLCYTGLMGGASVLFLGIRAWPIALAAPIGYLVHMGLQAWYTSINLMEREPGIMHWMEDCLQKFFDSTSAIVDFDFSQEIEQVFRRVCTISGGRAVAMRMIAHFVKLSNFSSGLRGKLNLAFECLLGISAPTFPIVDNIISSIVTFFRHTFTPLVLINYGFVFLFRIISAVIRNWTDNSQPNKNSPVIPPELITPDGNLDCSFNTFQKKIKVKIEGRSYSINTEHSNVAETANNYLSDSTEGSLSWNDDGSVRFEDENNRETTIAPVDEKKTLVLKKTK